MKKFLIILICLLVLTVAGLITRPSYILIGQLNWLDVLTKGYYVGSVPKLFTSTMLDESFFWVLKFSGTGLALGLVVATLAGGQKAKKKSKK